MLLILITVIRDQKLTFSASMRLPTCTRQMLLERQRVAKNDTST